jgi:hypothetical protein
MYNEMTINDKVVITTQAGDTYNAVVLEIGQNDIYVNLGGFGKLSVKWSDIWLIQKLIAPNSRGQSYGPSYKVTIWQNDYHASTAC